MAEHIRLTEPEYVLAHFNEHFQAYCGKRIVLHGTREYAEQIIARFDPEYCFLGAMTLEAYNGTEFCGKPIVTKEDLFRLNPDLIILTERVKYADAAYRDIEQICSKLGIRVMNMYGLDERELRESYGRHMFLSWNDIRKTLQDADVVCFELVDTFFRQEDGHLQEADPWMLHICRKAEASGKTVLFSLRKSFDQTEQVEALVRAGMYSRESVRDHVIERLGEDLSFRRLVEAYPGKKIIYFGTGLVNEYILPRCYGIEAFYSGPERSSYHVWYHTLLEQAPIVEEPQEDRLRILKQMIEEHDVISFDIFDTLLMRRTLVPADVFVLMKREQPDNAALIDERREIEHTDYHLMLDEIYEELKRRHPGIEDRIEDLKERELRTERKVIQQRRPVAELLACAAEAGKTVILVSDMYLTEKQLKEILDDAGIAGYDRIFVSCAYRKLKAEGLFLDVQKAYPGRRILHIGDNEQADLLPARKAGLDAFILPSCLSLAAACGYDDAVLSVEPEDRNMLGLLISTAFENPFRSLEFHRLKDAERLKRFGVMACAPVLIGYLGFLAQQIHRVQADKVLLTARDGYILQQLYTKLREKDRTLPPAEYFYMSRHAAFLCCCDDEAQADRVLSWSTQAPEEILRNVYEVQPEYPYNSEQSIRDYILSHQEQIRKKAEHSRQCCSKYLRECGAASAHRPVLTDFVSMGSSQYFLEQFSEIRFCGIYTGKPKYAAPLDTDITYYIDGAEGDFFRLRYMEMEYMMTSPEPSVDGFDEEGHPVFAQETRSSEDRERINALQTIVKKTVLEYMDLFYNGKAVSPRTVSIVYGTEDHAGILQERGIDDWTKQIM
ncbi:MAG: hypothetical protein IJJ24_00220 [Solobacterium sp.]|nr:hypothetical protein [Solobacterium sp.]